MLPEARAAPCAGPGEEGAEALALAEALRAARDLFD
jgi:hypothetical protein